MSTDRYDRQVRLFGEEGQRRIAAARVVVLGAGGLAMPLIQQLAYLGVLTYSVADSDVVSDTNLNRLVGATLDDVDELKVTIAERLIKTVQPTAQVTSLPVDLPHEAITAAVEGATVVVGCFDRETPRLVATDLCSSAGVPYVDLATEVMSTPTGVVFGGRVVIAVDGTGCVSCLDVIDMAELARERMTDEQRRLDDTIYGVERDALAGSGPSVVTLNSVVASLAATEIMCLLTGLRPVARQLNYRGDLGTVGRSREAGREGCPYCLRWRASVQARHPATG
jgi:molybdopterin/thiamine biosynthesis adenylyltransferase